MKKVLFIAMLLIFSLAVSGSVYADCDCCSDDCCGDDCDCYCDDCYSDDCWKHGCKDYDDCKDCQCYDTDAGKDYFSRGKVYRYGSALTDFCHGDTLYEYYCDKNTRRLKSYECSYGCHDGQCLRHDSGGYYYHDGIRYTYVYPETTTTTRAEIKVVYLQPSTTTTVEPEIKYVYIQPSTTTTTTAAEKEYVCVYPNGTVVRDCRNIIEINDKTVYIDIDPLDETESQSENVVYVVIGDESETTNATGALVVLSDYSSLLIALGIVAAIVLGVLVFFISQEVFLPWIVLSALIAIGGLWMVSSSMLVLWEGTWNWIGIIFALWVLLMAGYYIAGKTNKTEENRSRPAFFDYWD